MAISQCSLTWKTRKSLYIQYDVLKYTTVYNQNGSFIVNDYEYLQDIQLKDAGNNNSVLQLKLVLPWTNHIYIEYDLTTKWPPTVVSKTEPTADQELPEILPSSDPTTKPKPNPSPSQPDDSLNIHYTVVVKGYWCITFKYLTVVFDLFMCLGPYEFLHDITCNKTKKSFQQSQFQLSSCRSSSINFAAVTTTITKNTDYMPDRSPVRVISSVYRQALIARFWSTMRSIIHTDLLVKHLETYSPHTGHLFDKYNRLKQQTENHDRSQPLKLEIPPATAQIQEIDDISLSPINFNSIIARVEMKVKAEAAEAKSTVNLSIPGAPNRSPLRSGMPLFYHLPLNSNNYFSLKQNQVKFK